MRAICSCVKIKYIFFWYKDKSEFLKKNLVPHQNQMIKFNLWPFFPAGSLWSLCPLDLQLQTEGWTCWTAELQRGLAQQVFLFHFSPSVSLSSSHSRCPQTHLIPLQSMQPSWFTCRTWELQSFSSRVNRSWRRRRRRRKTTCSWLSSCTAK